MSSGRADDPHGRHRQVDRRCAQSSRTLVRRARPPSGRTQDKDDEQHDSASDRGIAALKFCDLAGLHCIIQLAGAGLSVSCRGPCAAAHGDENPRLGRHARAGDQQASAPADLPGDAAQPVHLAGGLLVCRRNHSSAMRRHIPVPAGKAPPAGVGQEHQAPPRLPVSSRTVGCSGTQLEFMGHDPKPASR